MTTTRSNPGLYLHVPFCSSICPYCDFSVMHAASPARTRFVTRLVEEIALAAPAWRDPRPFDTVYFGGGTPSQLTPEELAGVLEACRAHLAFEDPAPWIFLEANPEDVTAESCAAWRGLGVRTLSLGVQSFSDDALRFLGRRHTGRQARAAVAMARAAGFDTVSIDLIFGMRGQTTADWQLQLATAVSLEPQHVSCYQLTIHERTRFGVQAKHGRLSELPEDDQATLFELTHRFLADAGWPAYEVSNFARGEAHQSRHNRKYWDHTPYLGLGPSAHSLAASDAGSARRWWNERGTPQWEKRLAAGERPVEAEENLGPRDLAAEALLLGLRTTAGIDLDDLKGRYGIDLLGANDTLVARLVDEGRFVLSADADGGQWLVPTLAGLAVADGLAAAFDLTLPN